MNIYVVVEGMVGERKVYQHWIPLVNPSLSYVPHISDIEHDHFSIIAGGGYPQYYDVVENAIADVNDYGNIDRLVIVVDSEEMGYDEKHAEVKERVSRLRCVAAICIVIQHFCLEAWALGNRVIIRPNPHCPRLREYKRFYNVRVDDPELLPAYPPEELNRAQFAAKYLRRALNDKYRNLTYTKSNPGALLHYKYLERLEQRLEQTGHIPSFDGFLTAFV
jgi:hypothetical protein